MTDLSLDARPSRRIRLDDRAHDLLYNDQSTPAGQEAAKKVMEEVRQAAFVIDARDQVVKDRTGKVPRPALMDDIERTELVQGERFYS